MKLTLNKKTILMTTLATTFAWTLTVSADPYQANQGLEKIKTNFDNSKLNQTEYEKNLTVVNGNLAEINKAKASVLQQKNSVSQEILNNNESLKKVMIQERDIQAAIKEEQSKVALETKQIQDLEKAIETIKQNQAKRQQNIATYEDQLRGTQDEKTVWKSRESELRAQEGEAIKSLRGIASEESTWNGKKKGYEIEVKRWSAETEKQQKIFDTYQGLKQGN